MQGLQWTLLKEDEVIPRLLALEARRGRPSGSEGLGGGKGSRARRRKGRPPNVGEPETPGPTSAKLLRKLEAQGEGAALLVAMQHCVLTTTDDLALGKRRIRRGSFH